MEEKEPNVFDSPKLVEYKAMETKLYGELMKACRWYHNKLSLISIVGILELISQEIKDLDKTDFKNDDDETISNRDPLNRLI
ncbi:MAG TPA: hypothetical protein DSN98_04845 [Thermoplasmata archaeon]|jgi:hypothetical protein|nr:MAG TPA: hypothetical protein DSN98_04845 [Thermoplasmata archaeon]